MKGFLRFLGAVALIAICLGMGLAGGVVLDRQFLVAREPAATPAAPSTPAVAVPTDTASALSLMREAWDRIQESYVDRPAVDDQQMTYGAISGMVDALGDTGHSRFLSPEMVQAQHSFTSGEFEGIGTYVEMKDGQLVIVSPMDGTPAQQAGLHDIGTIEEAYRTLEPLLGSAASWVFAISLLASGLSSTSVGTMSGQIIMQGFLHHQIPVWIRRLVTMVPSLIVILIGLDPTRTLVLSQVVLSFGLPFAIIPLVLFTARRDVMGVLVNHRLTTVLTAVIAALIVALNIYLLVQVFVGG